MKNKKEINCETITTDELSLINKRLSELEERFENRNFITCLAIDLAAGMGILLILALLDYF